MKKKLLWNPKGDDSLSESIVGGNPSGLLNFNKTRYQWATSIYKVMRDSFWTPESVNTANEGKNYQSLSDRQKFRYDRVFARLSFLDSMVADSLMDNLNGYISNKIVNACLIEQAAQEVLHSKSYAVLLADAVEDSDEVFELYKNDLTLNAINTEIFTTFNSINEGEVTREKIFYALVANQLLEGIYFQTGFASIYLMGDIMTASASMIAEIHKDENNHIALFENIIREFVKENQDMSWFMIRPKVNKMFDDAYRIESSWMHYIFGDEFSEEITNSTVAYFCKLRARKIGMYDEEEDRFGHGRETAIVKMLNNRKSGNDTKTNFFESKVTNYSKQELTFDDDMDFAVNVDECSSEMVKQQSYEDAVRKKGM